MDDLPPFLRGGPDFDGRRWREMSHGIRYGFGNSTMAVSADDPPLVYVGTEVAYVYRSVDGGVTWDELRLLPDDRPLVDVSMINLSFLRLPNDGLLDPFVGAVPQGAFHGLSRAGHRPDAVSHDVSYPKMLTSYLNPRESRYTGRYALVGSGARVEVEDPGNLMASFFRGVAAQPGRVNWISICETNSHIAFAGTNFGAFRTRDMGITWDRVYVGSDMWENRVYGVHCHPEDSNVVYLATHSGIRMSRDGGDEWARASVNVGIWPSYFITTHPLDREKVLVGTNLGAYVTNPVGDEQEEIYLKDTPSPFVRQVPVIRPTMDENVYYVGTVDGAWYSHDGGETWVRMGEFLVGHYPVWAIEADPRDPMHAYIMSRWHVFETVDGGKTLIELLPGYTKLRRIMLAPADPDQVWLAGWSNLWVYEQSRPLRPGPPTELCVQAREALHRDPGHHAVEDKIMVRAGIDDASVRRHRRRIRLSSLLPTLSLVGWYYRNEGDLIAQGVGGGNAYTRYASVDCLRRMGKVNRGAAEFNHCQYQSRVFDFLLGSPFSRVNGGGLLVLSWPLARVVADERTTGRLWDDIYKMRTRLVDNVYYYWADRRRLLEFLASGRATDAEEQTYLMRLEEMSAVLDSLSGGFMGGPFGDIEWALD
jgi:photosystem II stability/assembly factor-like uncharacterized protein